jgi:hypothetical protein
VAGIRGFPLDYSLLDNNSYLSMGSKTSLYFNEIKNSTRIRQAL